jgi:hypothetical protein
MAPQLQSRIYTRLSDVTVQFPIYSYRVPVEITEPLALAMYWNVMNRSRSRPYMPRFVVTDALKQRY